jgi:hypothetical protein
MPNRRKLFAASLAGAALLAPRQSRAACPSIPLDRAAYDRYVALFNAADPRFTDYYDDDVKFVMQVRGKAGVLAFYARQRPYVKESLDILFFCSDATGAAAEVRGAFRCIKNCDDPSIFGRALKAGEVQRTHGYLLYALNSHGKIAEIKGPPPEIVQPWRIETA